MLHTFVFIDICGDYLLHFVVHNERWRLCRVYIYFKPQLADSKVMPDSLVNLVAV